MVNFPNILYPRMTHAVLEVNQRGVMFSLIHGIYKNRERLFQQNRADDSLCANQACRNEGLAQTTEYMFYSCYRVRTASQTRLPGAVAQSITVKLYFIILYCTVLYCIVL
jgi:hypothetical protein